LRLDEKEDGAGVCRLRRGSQRRDRVVLRRRRYRSRRRIRDFEALLLRPRRGGDQALQLAFNRLQRSLKVIWLRRQPKRALGLSDKRRQLALRRIVIWRTQD